MEKLLKGVKETTIYYLGSYFIKKNEKCKKGGGYKYNIIIDNPYYNLVPRRHDADKKNNNNNNIMHLSVVSVSVVQVMKKNKTIVI